MENFSVSFLPKSTSVNEAVRRKHTDACVCAENLFEEAQLPSRVPSFENTGGKNRPDFHRTFLFSISAESSVTVEERLKCWVADLWGGGGDGCTAVESKMNR